MKKVTEWKQYLSIHFAIVIVSLNSKVGVFVLQYNNTLFFVPQLKDGLLRAKFFGIVQVQIG